MSDLLSPEFCRRLAKLRVVARRRFAGSSSGARRSTRRGASAEFADHRPYYAGDDVRRIDWNAYARLDELVLRLYVAEEDLTLHLLLDTSGSLGFGSPSKLEVAKRAAAALGFVALSGSERVTVAPFTTGIGPVLPPSRGKRRVGAFLRHLDGLESSGATNIGRAVDEFLSRRPRPGVACVLSDLLDPGGYQRPLDRLAAERHDVVIVHVVDPSELDPSDRGDFVLVDSERGDRVEVSVDDRVLAAYRARVRWFLDDAEAYAKRRGFTYLRVSAAGDLEAVLLDYLRGRVA